MSANFNKTVNGTHAELLSHCINPTAERIGKSFFYCLFFALSLIGNTFIGIIVYKTKALPKPINFFIVNMAMSDLLYPIFLFPWKVTQLHFSSWLISGPLGQALCKLSPFLGDCSFAVSVQNLVLIAVDRFGAVVFPLRSPLISLKLCPYFILAPWIIEIAFHFPYLFAFKLFKYPGGAKCLLRWDEVFGDTLSVRNYFSAASVVFIFVLLSFTIILYLTIVLKLKFQKPPGEPSVNARAQRVKRERNVQKMAIAIVLVFAICWLPIAIVKLLSYHPPGGTMVWSCYVLYFWHIAYFLACSYCAINPWICFIFSGNYRQGLKNLLSGFSAGPARFSFKSKL